MSLQHFRFPPPSDSQLETVLETGSTITFLGIAAASSVLPALLRPPVLLAIGPLAGALRAALSILYGAVVSWLASRTVQSTHSPALTTNDTLADSLWLNCGYRFDVRYQPI